MKHENVGFPRERVGLDLRGSNQTLQLTKGVIQDCFSKRMELYALQRKTAEAVVSVLPKGGGTSRDTK